MPIKHPVAPAAENITWIRDTFLSHGYTMPDILARLGIEKCQMWTHDPDLQKKTILFLANKSEDELDILIRIFALNSTEKRELAEKIFSESELDKLAKMNVLSVCNEEYVSCDIALSECDGLLIATDSFLKFDPDINLVMPLIGEVYEFAAARTRKKVEDTLDLCTGSGVHGLLASRHSSRVTCVDNNPRAIAFAKFNRALNDIVNVEILEGDLFSPLGEKMFDLILANPPYMPTMDSKPGDNHFSGGEKGDFISSKIIEGLPRYLRKNGLCQIIHLMVCFDNQSMEMWVRSHLRDHAGGYSFLVLGSPVTPGDELTAKASLVEWGVTNIKRNDEGADSFYCHKDYIYPVNFDIHDLFEALSIAVNDKQRKDLCATF